MPASPCSDPTSDLATSSSRQSSFLCQSSPYSSVEQQHEVGGAGMLTQLRLGHEPGGPRKPVSHPHSFSLSLCPASCARKHRQPPPKCGPGSSQPACQGPTPSSQQEGSSSLGWTPGWDSQCLPQTAHLPGRVSVCVISPFPESSPWGINPNLTSSHPFLPNSMWIFLSFSLSCTALSGSLQ